MSTTQTQQFLRANTLCQATKQQLNSQKRWNMKRKANPLLCLRLSCVAFLSSVWRNGVLLYLVLVLEEKKKKKKEKKLLQERREIFFSRVNFLCWLLFRYPFHPRVTAVARAGGRLQLNTHTPYVCGFAWSDMVHGCMVYTEHAEMPAVSCGTSHASAVSTPLRCIFKNAL